MWWLYIGFAIHTNSFELRSPEFPRTPSASRPEYFTVLRKNNRVFGVYSEIPGFNKTQHASDDGTCVSTFEKR
jgi:hypothetical protein